MVKFGSAHISEADILAAGYEKVWKEGEVIAHDSWVRVIRGNNPNSLIVQIQTDESGGWATVRQVSDTRMCKSLLGQIGRNIWCVEEALDA